MIKNDMDNAEKLLDSAADELEILVFTIDDQVFGVNVSQVREILMPEAVDKVPQGHPSVEGVYMPRDILITVINLADYLGIYLPPDQRTLFIVSDVNKLNAAFRVNNVLGIERISDKNIEKAEVSYAKEGVLFGIVRVNKRLISLVDFEKVVEDIAP
ncbi:chemotaxis protein CheW [Clostridium aminobutyricum]|uniref:Purine-binding chemotaxis protein CheW n=1 Tax=Clostridium aminobutyricum TaxID=33953 RepID=A0A939IIX7_CLOAM|nr:chemotaxis protein CheW [Clostridium aminobutyricum]MBN7773023.1 purine-binding chemotaxis protein CheW [Clostridium aminobutyricum]